VIYCEYCGENSISAPYMDHDIFLDILGLCPVCGTIGGIKYE